MRNFFKDYYVAECSWSPLALGPRGAIAHEVTGTPGFVHLRSYLHIPTKGPSPFSSRTVVTTLNTSRSLDKTPSLSGDSKDSSSAEHRASPAQCVVAARGSALGGTKSRVGSLVANINLLFEKQNILDILVGNKTFASSGNTKWRDDPRERVAIAGPAADQSLDPRVIEGEAARKVHVAAGESTNNPTQSVAHATTPEGVAARRSVIAPGAPQVGRVTNSRNFLRFLITSFFVICQTDRAYSVLSSISSVQKGFGSLYSLGPTVMDLRGVARHFLLGRYIKPYVPGLAPKIFKGLPSAGGYRGPSSDARPLVRRSAAVHGVFSFAQKTGTKFPSWTFLLNQQLLRIRSIFTLLHRDLLLILPVRLPTPLSGKLISGPWFQFLFVPYTIFFGIFYTLSTSSGGAKCFDGFAHAGFPVTGTSRAPYLVRKHESTPILSVPATGIKTGSPPASHFVSGSSVVSHEQAIPEQRSHDMPLDTENFYSYKDVFFTQSGTWGFVNARDTCDAPPTSYSFKFFHEVLRLAYFSSKIFLLWGFFAIWKGVRPAKSIKNDFTLQPRILKARKNKKRFSDLEGLEKFSFSLKNLIHSLQMARLAPWSLGVGPTRHLDLRSLWREGEAARKSNPHATTSATSVKLRLGGASQVVPDNIPPSAERSAGYLEPKGFLFIGPPGTGKTVLAQAIAGEAGVNLLCVSASEIQKQIDVGTRIGAIRLRNLFEQARKNAPCILFLDEIDSIGKIRSSPWTTTKGPSRAEPPVGPGRSSRAEVPYGHRGTFGPSLGGTERSRGHADHFVRAGSYTGGTNEDLKLFTEFLIQMDSFSLKDRFIVIGTTNFLSSLDSAFIRSGRFDRVLSLQYPSKQTRISILKMYMQQPAVAHKVRGLIPGSTKPLMASIPWNFFGEITKGLSGADLAKVINESFLYSIDRRFRNAPGPSSEIEGLFSETDLKTLDAPRSATPLGGGSDKVQPLAGASQVAHAPSRVIKEVRQEMALHDFDGRALQRSGTVPNFNSFSEDTFVDDTSWRHNRESLKRGLERISHR